MISLPMVAPVSLISSPVFFVFPHTHARPTHNTLWSFLSLFSPSSSCTRSKIMAQLPCAPSHTHARTYGPRPASPGTSTCRLVTRYISPAQPPAVNMPPPPKTLVSQAHASHGLQEPSLPTDSFRGDLASTALPAAAAACLSDCCLSVSRRDTSLSDCLLLCSRDVANVCS